MQEKMIHVKIVSDEGHTDLALSSQSAVSTIADKCANEAKWLYIDGVHVGDLSGLTINRLEEAEDITMTNQLGGGAF